LDEATYDLGRLYLRWAAEEGPGEQRSMLARQAAEFLDRALIFQPGAEWVWVDRALLDQLFLGRPEEAAKKMAQADILIRGDTPVVWGDAYRERSVNALQPEIAQFYARRAMAHYQRGVDENKLDRGLLARCLVHKGGLQLSLREWDSATATLLQALEQAPPEEAWPAEIMLAQIYVQQGQKELALRYVTTAIEKAPLEKKLSLIELQQQIMAH
jgi:tetratricopeptide (TPR) repeat protein